MSNKDLQEKPPSLTLPVALLLNESMELLAVDGKMMTGEESPQRQLTALLGQKDWSALGSFLDRMQPGRSAVQCMLERHQARCEVLQDPERNRRLFYVRLYPREEDHGDAAPEQTEGVDAVALSFARSLAHDLRSPLSAISMCLSLIKNRYGNELDERTKEHLRRAEGVLDRTGALIQEHLEQYLAAGHRWERKPTSMDRIACEAVEQLEALVAEHDADIEMDDLPVVSGNPLRLRQLMQNLIENAVRHGAQGRPKVHIGAERGEGQEWIFSVSDNGAGFDEREADRLFEPGYSEDGAKKDSHGLGLALAKEIVEEHDGRIWARSTPGEGSTFYFSLPEAEKTAEA